MQLMDMHGICCGNFDGDPPAGYWLRPDNAPDNVTRLEFFDRFGPARFKAIFEAMLVNHDLAFTVFRGFAAETIHITESFPALIQMEQMGLIPAGSAIEVWS